MRSLQQIIDESLTPSQLIKRLEELIKEKGFVDGPITIYGQYAASATIEESTSVLLDSDGKVIIITDLSTG